MCPPESRRRSRWRSPRRVPDAAGGSWPRSSTSSRSPSTPTATHWRSLPGEAPTRCRCGRGRPGGTDRFRRCATDCCAGWVTVSDSCGSPTKEARSSWWLPPRTAPSGPVTTWTSGGCGPSSPHRRATWWPSPTIGSSWWWSMWRRGRPRSSTRTVSGGSPGPPGHPTAGGLRSAPTTRSWCRRSTSTTRTNAPPTG